MNPENSPMIEPGSLIESHMRVEAAGVVDCLTTALDRETLESRYNTFRHLRKNRVDLKPGDRLHPKFVRRCAATYERQKLLIAQGERRARLQLEEENEAGLYQR